jgi:hypothetical protein
MDVVVADIRARTTRVHTIVNAARKGPEGAMCATV